MGKSNIKLLVLVVFVAVFFFVPPPAGLTAPAWRLFGIFVGSVAGLVMRVMPDAPFLLMAITVASFIIPLKDIMVGYMDGVVWMMVAALMLSVGFKKSGLARRLGLYLISKLGKSSLSIAYSLSILEVILSTSTPSIPARTAGLVYPLAEGVFQVCESEPGKSSRKIGSYITVMLYSVSAVAASLFMTGSGPSMLNAKIAGDMLGVHITWPMWAIAALPGYLGIIFIPYLIYRLFPPELKSLEVVRAMVDFEREKMGAITFKEKIAGMTFLIILVGWATSTITNMDATHVAFIGVSLMLLFGIIEWNDVAGAKDVWTTLMWFGAFVGMSAALAKYKFFTWLAAGLKATLPVGGVSEYTALLLVALLVTLFHYIFPSVVGYVVAFSPLCYSFVSAVGVPAYPAAFLVLFLMPISSSLTHYGNGVAPILFAKGFVDLKTWWIVGFIVSMLMLIVYMTVGIAYWKLIGFWY